MTASGDDDLVPNDQSNEDEIDDAIKKMTAY